MAEMYLMQGFTTVRDAGGGNGGLRRAIHPAKSQPDLAILYLGLFGWSLAVDAHIYRHALSIKMGNGVLLAVLIFAANFMLLKAVFG
jgi:hypothetical protein